MKRQNIIVIILVGLTLAIFLLLILSHHAANKKVHTLLRKDEIIGKVQLSYSWPLHWHFVIDTLWLDDPFHEPHEIADQSLICISLFGDYLRAYPAHPNDRDFLNMLENSRMECAYGRGTNWVVEKNPFNNGALRPRRR
jgi:hypothetical protein